MDRRNKQVEVTIEKKSALAGHLDLRHTLAFTMKKNQIMAVVPMGHREAVTRHETVTAAIEQWRHHRRQGHVSVLVDRWNGSVWTVATKEGCRLIPAGEQLRAKVRIT